MPGIDAFHLVDKHFLITGGSSGIGRATGRVLSKMGARVTLLGRNEERLKQALAECEGEGHSQFAFDLMNVDEIPAFLKHVASEKGGLSGIFHSAGSEAIRPLSLLSAKNMDAILTLNIKVPLLLARAFCQKDVQAAGMGSLVFMSSVAGLRGQVGLSLYCAGKGGLDAAVRALACELAPRRVRVNSIAAGAVRTEMHERITRNLPENALKDYEEKHLMGFGSPEDIGLAVGYLFSDASRWVTGTTLVVDGGYTCK